MVSKALALRLKVCVLALSAGLYTLSLPQAPCKLREVCGSAVHKGRRAKEKRRRRRRRVPRRPEIPVSRGGGGGEVIDISDDDCDDDDEMIAVDFGFRGDLEKVKRGAWLSTMQVQALMLFWWDIGSSEVSSEVRAGEGANYTPEVTRLTQGHWYRILQPSGFDVPQPLGSNPGIWQGFVANTSDGNGQHWVNVIWRNRSAFVVDPAGIASRSQLLHRLTPLFDSVEIISTGTRQVDGWTCGYRAARLATYLFPRINADGSPLPREDVRSLVESFAFDESTIDLEIAVLNLHSLSDSVFSKYLSAVTSDRSRSRHTHAVAHEDFDTSNLMYDVIDTRLGEVYMALDGALQVAWGDDDAPLSSETAAPAAPVDPVDPVDPAAPADPADPVPVSSHVLADPNDDAEPKDPVRVVGPARVLTEEDMAAYLKKERTDGTKAAKPTTSEGVAHRASFSQGFKHVLATYLRMFSKTRDPEWSTVSIMTRFVGGEARHLSDMAQRIKRAFPANVTALPERHSKTRTMRQPGGGRKAYFPVLEATVLAWAVGKRALNEAVTKAMLREKVLSEAQKIDGCENFKCSDDFLLAFASRNSFTFRAQTTSKYGTTEAAEHCNRFWSMVRWLSSGYYSTPSPLPQSSLLRSRYGVYTKVVNMDETPMYRSASGYSDKVLVPRDSAQPVLRQDVDRGMNRFATLVGCVCFDVLRQAFEPVRQMIVYRGEGKRLSEQEEKVHRESGVSVAWQKKGWVDEKTLGRWIDVVLRPLCKAGERVLLVWDSAPSHMTQASKNLVHKWCDLVTIPGGMTMTLQYLDRHGFARFKSEFHTRLDGMKSVATRGCQTRASRKLSDNWYREAMSSLVPAVWRERVEGQSKESVRQQMRELGYVLPISGIDDSSVRVPTLPDVRFAARPFVHTIRHSWLDILRRENSAPFLQLLWESGKPVESSSVPVPVPRAAPRQMNLRDFFVRKSTGPAEGQPAQKRSRASEPTQKRKRETEQAPESQAPPPQESQQTKESQAPESQQPKESQAPQPQESQQTKESQAPQTPAQPSRKKRHVICRKCGEAGHYQKTCKAKKAE